MKRPRKSGTRGRVRGKPKTSKQAVETAEKYARALELRKQGKTLKTIADELGYSGPSGAHQALTRAIGQTVSEPAEDVRALELLRLDALFEKAWGKVESGDISLGDFILRLMARRAKLQGLDAPIQSKVEVQENYKGMSDAEVCAEVIKDLLSKSEQTEMLLEAMKARGYLVTPPKE